MDDMVVRFLGLTSHLAGHSRDAEGNPCCCVCGTNEQLVYAAPGGVRACRDCQPSDAQP